VRKRYVVRTVVPAVLGILAVAGCGGSESGGGDATGSGEKTYTLGYQGPLSGGNAALGINMVNGVQLAVEQANASGDLPFKLDWTKADDQGSADGSPPAARKLIDNDDVVAVIGPAFSGASAAAGDLYKKANMVAVTPSATLPELTDQGFTTFYRANADDNAQGPPDAKYLINTVKAKSIYLVDDTSDYGKGLANAFKAEVSNQGQELAGEDSAPQTSTCVPGATGSTSQYPGIASKIKGSGADALFYAGYYCDAGLLVKALRNAGFTGQVMSGDGTYDSKYIEGAGADNAEGTLLSCQCSDIASNPNGKQFVKDYKEKFGVAPGAYSAEAFDVTNAVIEVMKGLDTIDRDSIVAAFGDVDYQGLTKEIKFASETDHNLEVQTAFLYEVKNGELSYIGDLTDLTS
jgi:branched-chain amino acid transport system substrate-binding protein